MPEGELISFTVYGAYRYFCGSGSYWGKKSIHAKIFNANG